jgi:hypothetical protein
MVACAVGSPRLHPCSREVAAFFSESINRVIITGGNLSGSDSMGWRSKDIRTYTKIPLLRGEKPDEQTMRTVVVSLTCQGVV